MQRKNPSLFLLWLFIPEPLLFPLPPLFFPPSSLESAPINLENQLHKHSSQSRGELLSLHLLYCFTTKNPYGFRVGYKEPKPRPKILPKTDLNLRGPSHIGFGLQNHQNQCSIQAGPTNQLNRLPTS